MIKSVALSVNGKCGQYRIDYRGAVVDINVHMGARVEDLDELIEELHAVRGMLVYRMIPGAIPGAKADEG